MKKILAILLALTMVLALAVPTFAATGDTQTLPISLTKDTVGNGYFLDTNDVTTGAWVTIKITGTAVVTEGTAEADSWFRIYPSTPAPGMSSSGTTDNTHGHWDPGATRVLVSADGTVSYEGLWNLNKGNDLAGITFKDFNVVESANLSVTITEGIPYFVNNPEEASKPYATVETYLGSVEKTSATYVALNLPATYAAGETFVIHIIGSSDGDFRYYASEGDGNADTQMNTSSAPVNGGLSAFDHVYEITTTRSVNKYQFRGPSYGVNLNNLEVAYVGFFKGTLEQYQAAIDALNPEATKYAVTVTNGTADKETAAEGEIVTITANEPEEGREFSKWISGDVTVADKTATTTTFVMPAEDVKVTAKFQNADAEEPEEPEEPEQPEDPEEPEQPGDEDVYKLVEKNVGALNGVSGGQQVMGITPVELDDTVVVHIIGSSDGTFRTWLSKGTWSRASDITTVDAGEFDMLIVMTAYDADKKSITEATEIQFKGPSGGSLNNLTVSYCGIYYGTMDEYKEAIKAKEDEALDPEVPEEVKGSSGFLTTGDETHMIIINGAVITTAHEFVDGICVYCGHVDTTADDEVIVEIVDPVEPSTEEEEDETVPAEPSEEPEEDTNPETGLALALVPMMIAAAVAVITKK